MSPALTGGAMIGRRKGAFVLAVSGARDHIHVYVSLSARTSVASLVDALKGYSAFSICRRCEAKVISYIRNQEAHHGPAREGGVEGD